MNAQNAQAIGYEDGKRFFRLGMDEMKRLPKETLLTSARNRAFYSYGAKALKTIDLYVKGYEEAINAYEAEQAREQREAEARAAIPHNPSSRFCMCAECSKGE